MGRSSGSSWLATLGVLGAAGFLAYLVYATADDDESGGADSGKRGSEKLDKTKLLSLWTMLVKNMELHRYQIQQVLYQQQSTLAQRGTIIPDEQIEQMYKQHFEEILDNVQGQVLQHFDVTEEELEQSTMKFSNDPEISAVVAELESLYLGDNDSSEPEVDVGKLERIIYDSYNTAYVEAYKAVVQDFKSQGKDIQENEAEFRTSASTVASLLLEKRLEGTGLTEKDLNKLILKHQTEPRIYMALQASQAQQAEAIKELGLEFLLA